MSEVKITPTKAECEGEKRQNVPFRISMKCPSCGRSWNTDLSDQDHLTRTVWGKTAKVYAYCVACDAEWQIVVVPTITLQLDRVDYEQR